ncbi:bifunctional methylenetetrahydrofolate dehydrogenase/methenyltetrahydrofolate cyclohydrolase FolD [Sphingobium lactosutens]|uniref:bifunctional methylenetetrahydrofolate dehydrogenase/methenyltetrahydrofolate cyclohydrolase FolD n=1 Tax=Sphingobium lactosutens TaxID=522773 RepID=UPI0015C10EC5|nr:bifunctional methylenetetrahydrofolate dehydrogenase/methenyltetrahydrofolate cyclohydrolase FolD [Sphingobium lactosutens]NWK97509.1 bifunctional methylenetetrahydrofolate dehydrogenase/methenyltetrahydrofolate cyclohydrolase FolD [Sphingobium lactosutens]
MSETKIIDGKAVAAALKAEIRSKVARLQHSGPIPGLAVVLVGHDPASEIYVRSKIKQTTEVGLASIEHRLDSDVLQEDLLRLVEELNEDPAVHGILVQLPLPAHINSTEILLAIDPRKDVDGFHPINVGMIATQSGGIVPCTPLGSMKLIQSVRPDLAGLKAIIIGRSNIVGKPMAQLLLAQDCTVTLAHSKTRNLAEEIAASDIVVAAVGRPHCIRGEWIKPGAIVIDVGINRIVDEQGQRRIVGDVAFDEALGRAGAITPVPGGVGPMTIACLLSNTVDAFLRETCPD